MMMFNPPPKGGQAYEGWRGIYYQGLCPWLPKCRPDGAGKGKEFLCGTWCLGDLVARK